MVVTDDIQENAYGVNDMTKSMSKFTKFI